MRPICLVIHNLNVGGAETHVSQIFPELKRQGCEIEVFVLSPPLTLAEPFKSADIPIHLAPQSSFLPMRIFKRLVFLVKAFRARPDSLFHFFLPTPYILGRVAALLSGHRGPTVMSRRSLNTYQQKYPLIGWVEKCLHRMTTRILGNSQAIIDQLKNEENVPLEKLSLIYNGIDTAPFKNAPLFDKSAYDLESFLMVITANLIPYKGHRDLLEALLLFQKQYKGSFDLLCVGEDRGILKDLKDQVQKTTLKGHVHFMGPRQDVASILKAANLGILASHEEGFSNAILEYMAAGLPVVATNVGGNPEAVLDGQTGFIVPPKDPKSLSEAILKLAGDSKLCTSFGVKGQERLAKEFSRDACVAKYLKFYRELV